MEKSARWRVNCPHGALGKGSNLVLGNGSLSLVVICRARIRCGVQERPTEKEKRKVSGSLEASCTVREIPVWILASHSTCISP